jgi:hypothetical protein
MFYVLILLILMSVASGLRLRGETITNSNVVPEYFCSQLYDCPQHSSCSYYNSTTGICSCDSGFTTQNDDFCSYKQKNAVTALVLTIVLTEIAPIGMLYVDPDLNNPMTIGQLVTCGILGALMCCLGTFIVISIVSGLTRQALDKDLVVENLKIVAAVVQILTFVWWIYDVVGFATGRINDGNGVPLTDL